MHSDLSDFCSGDRYDPQRGHGDHIMKAFSFLLQNGSAEGSYVIPFALTILVRVAISGDQAQCQRVISLLLFNNNNNNNNNHSGTTKTDTPEWTLLQRIGILA